MLISNLGLEGEVNGVSLGRVGSIPGAMNEERRKYHFAGTQAPASGFKRLEFQSLLHC